MSKAACYLAVKRLRNKYRHKYDHFTFLFDRNLTTRRSRRAMQNSKNSGKTAIKTQKLRLTRRLKDLEK